MPLKFRGECMKIVMTIVLIMILLISAVTVCADKKTLSKVKEKMKELKI